MKSQNYIILLISSQKNQAIALLETASPQQVVDLTKVIYNLSANRSILQPKTKTLLSKNKKTINKLLNKKVSQISKYRLIRNKAKDIFQLIISAKNVLVRALQQ